MSSNPIGIFFIRPDQSSLGPQENPSLRHENTLSQRSHELNLPGSTPLSGSSEARISTQSAIRIFLFRRSWTRDDTPECGCDLRGFPALADRRYRKRYGRDRIHTGPVAFPSGIQPPPCRRMPFCKTSGFARRRP